MCIRCAFLANETAWYRYYLTYIWSIHDHIEHAYCKNEHFTILEMILLFFFFSFSVLINFRFICSYTSVSIICVCSFRIHITGIIYHFMVISRLELYFIFFYSVDHCLVVQHSTSTSSVTHIAQFGIDTNNDSNTILTLCGICMRMHAK